MGQSIKLADDVMESIRIESKRQSRSVAGQVTHYIRIGQVIEKSGTFDYDRISEVHAALRSPDELSSEEQAVWFDEFTNDMANPSEAETAFYKKRRKLGRGVGVNNVGELVFADE